MKCNVHRPSRARGFSLLEVLISILILAFGVLSMGGLQLASLKSVQASGNFAMAATLAKDYTEMMRSNTTVSSNTSTVAGVNPYLFDTTVSSSFSATPAVDCKANVCTQAQISSLHVADWVERVQAALPGGTDGVRAVVCRDPAPRNADGSYRWDCGTNNATAITIKIGWIDRRDSVERGTTTVSLTPLNPQMVMAGFTGYAE
jgi:type IV pilus assembly protein PilV